jgi:aryl-alcohol dehydrogenase-like predicted oxidoreductase
VRGSLRRLKTDHIDLYQMHHVDRRTPWDEIWQAMEQLVREGKVTYVGSSNFAGWDIATAQSVGASRHFLGLASEQSLYNLNARTIELRSDSGAPLLRHRSHSMEPDRHGAAGRRASEDTRGSPGHAAPADAD